MTPVEIVARALCKASDLTWHISDNAWFERKAQAALDALTAAGFVVVPIVSTDAMNAAAWPLEVSTNDIGAGPKYAAIWSAMIAASQSTEQQP